jgi:hypothetical protein
MVHPSRTGWRLAAGCAALVTGLATATAGPAVAHDRAPTATTPAVVATALHNPRHLQWYDGGLYVAEAGRGGSGACLPAPEAEGEDTCVGATGSITRVQGNRQRRVVTKLPSLAVESGEGAIGPSDVRVHGRRFTVALGLGADPTRRVELGAAGRRLGTVSTGRLGSSRLRVVADVAAHEALTNPDGKVEGGQKVLDTNPVGLVQRGRTSMVVDAGGNALLSYQHHDVDTVAVFPSTPVPGPGGATIPMDAVPTAAAVGPDGAIYVSQLTGFPFPVGGASIWRVAPGKAPVKYATGLTNVTDLAFGRDGSLYAVELTVKGLLAGDATSGAVVRIPRGGGAQHTTVAGSLPAPYGIALHGDSAYVTTHTNEAGTGAVVRIGLGRTS